MMLNLMIGLLLQIWASFTYPLVNQAENCLGGTQPLTDLDSVFLFGTRQSATWVYLVNTYGPNWHEDNFLFAVYWPTIRKEADIQLIQMKKAKAPGMRDTLTFYDKFTPWLSYWTILTDTTGNASCRSNVIYRSP